MLTAALPATPPAAIGIVTIEHYSKLRDYVNAALFFVLVPPLTIWLRRIGARLVRRRFAGANDSLHDPLPSRALLLPDDRQGGLGADPSSRDRLRRRSRIRSGAHEPVASRSLRARAGAVSTPCSSRKGWDGSSSATWRPGGGSPTSRRSFSRSLRGALSRALLVRRVSGGSPHGALVRRLADRRVPPHRDGRDSVRRAAARGVHPGADAFGGASRWSSPRSSSCFSLCA